MKYLRNDGEFRKVTGFPLVSGQVIAEYIEKEKATVYLTIGFGYKNPTTHNKKMSPSEAIEWINKRGQRYWLELGMRDNGELHLNAYTDNDML